MSFWSGKNDSNPMDQSTVQRLHVPISAPNKPIAKDKIPAAGPIAFLPSDVTLAKAAQGYFEAELSDLKDIKIQRGVEEVNEETRGIVWLDASATNIKMLEEILIKYKRIDWIQLPMAGINAYSELTKNYADKVWTSAKGAYSQPVAEHALTLILALLRYLPMRIRAKSWGPSQGLSLFNSNILILGAGGITISLLAQLEPFSPNVTVLRRKAEPLDDEVVPAKLKDRVHVSTLSDLDKHLPQADIVVAACALTADTRDCLAKQQFSLMQKHAIVVNVARGEVLHTDDLVAALKEGQIGGAALDVTAPEPLPSDHALWNLTTSHDAMDVEEEKGGKRANVIITPHTADTIHQIVPLFAQRVRQNVEAFQSGNGLFSGVVDAEEGY